MKKMLLLAMNFIKKFKSIIGIVLFFFPIIIKNFFNKRRVKKYNKNYKKLQREQDGETLDKKIKRYNKDRG